MKKTLSILLFASAFLSSNVALSAGSNTVVIGNTVISNAPIDALTNVAVFGDAHIAGDLRIDGTYHGTGDGITGINSQNGIDWAGVRSVVGENNTQGFFTFADDGTPHATFDGSVLTNISANQVGAVPTNYSGMTYYVAPWPIGNDTNNNGLSQFTPFQSVQQAEQYVRPGDTVHLMDGTNTVHSPLFGGLAGVTNFLVELPGGVNWFSEPNAWLVITNYGAPGSSSRAFFCCTGGNNTIDNLNLYVPDTTNSETVIGYGQIDSAVGHTNIVFNNLNLVSWGTGIRLESAANVTTNLCQMSFNNPKIIANANCVTMKDWRFAHVTITGGEMWCRNSVANGVINFKPMRAIALESQSSSLSTNALVMNGTIIHVSDVDLSNSNRPAYFVWSWTSGLLHTNVATFNGCTIDWLSRTNPGSFDISTNLPGTINVNGCTKTDGHPLTYPAGYAPNFGTFQGTVPAANLIGSGTFSGDGSGLTNMAGGKPMIVTNAATLVTKAAVQGTDRAFMVGFILSPAPQAINSNYVTIKLSKATSVNPVVASYSLQNWGNGAWTNSSTSAIKFLLSTTSNSITVMSLPGVAPAPGQAVAIGITDQ